MSFHAIGDLAHSMTMRHHHADLQSRLARLSEEMSTGVTANISRHLAGSFGQLSDIEHGITVNAAYRKTGAEASAQATSMQAALELVQSRLSDVSGTALVSTASAGGPGLGVSIGAARDGLDAIVSALNTNLAGRPVFAGTALGQPPLVGSEELMVAVRSMVSTAGNAASLVSTLDTFFDGPNGGFDRLIYKGGSQNLAPVDLGGGESVQLALRADDPVLRSALKNTVMAALAGDDDLSLSMKDRQTLVQTAGTALLKDVDDLIGIRSNLGTAEARIERSLARLSAEDASLAIMRNEIMAVDRFETASALEQVQLQLESLYTVTARSSRLSLVNFL